MCAGWSEKPVVVIHIDRQMIGQARDPFGRVPAAPEQPADIRTKHSNLMIDAKQGVPFQLL